MRMSRRFAVLREMGLIPEFIVRLGCGAAAEVSSGVKPQDAGARSHASCAQCHPLYHSSYADALDAAYVPAWLVVT